MNWPLDWSNQLHFCTCQAEILSQRLPVTQPCALNSMVSLLLLHPDTFTLQRISQPSSQSKHKAEISLSIPQPQNSIAPAILQAMVIRPNRGNKEENLCISDGFLNCPLMCMHQMKIRIWLEALALRCVAQR